MNALKIVRLAVLVVAVIGAFVAIPEAALIMTILGLVMGYLSDQADKTNRLYYFVFAVALSSVYGAAGALPIVGEYITAILGNMSAIVNAGAVAVIILAIKDRAME